MEALENKGTTHRVYPLRLLTTASYTQMPLMMECMSHARVTKCMNPIHTVAKGNKL